MSWSALSDRTEVRLSEKRPAVIVRGYLLQAPPQQQQIRFAATDCGDKLPSHGVSGELYWFSSGVGPQCRAEPNEL